MFDTASLVIPTHYPSTLKRLQNELGNCTRYGQSQAVAYRGWHTDDWGYLMVKWAKRDEGFLVSERGYFQEPDSEPLDALLRQSEMLCKLADSTDVHLGRLDFVHDAPDGLLAHGAQYVAPSRSRMVRSQYGPADSAETFFYRNKSGGVRFYDKALESQRSDIPWERCELQLRARYLRDIAGGQVTPAFLESAGQTLHARAFERFGLSHLLASE